MGCTSSRRVSEPKAAQKSASPKPSLTSPEEEVKTEEPLDSSAGAMLKEILSPLT